MALIFRSIRILAFTFFLTTLCNAQTLEWAGQFSGPIENTGNAVAADLSGNVFTTGYFRGTVDFDPGENSFDLTSVGASNDIYLTKFNTDGALEWAFAVGSSADDRGQALVVDQSGDLIIAGYFRSTADFNPAAGTTNLTSFGSEDAFVAKYNSNGELIWARRIGGGGNDRALAVAVDQNNNILVTGFISFTATFESPGSTFDLTSGGQEDTFVAKLNPQGDFEWAVNFSGASVNHGRGIATDNLGNVYTTGYFNGSVDFNPGTEVETIVSQGQSDIYVHKLTGNGDFEWATSFYGSDAGTGVAISCDSNNELTIAGYFEGTFNFSATPGENTFTALAGNDSFVAQLSSSGNLVWLVHFESESDALVQDVFIDNMDRLFVTGTVQNEMEIYTTSGRFLALSSGPNAFFITELNLSGALYGYREIASEDLAIANSIYSNGTDNLYLTGQFSGNVDFDPGTNSSILESSGNFNSFVQKFSLCLAVFSFESVETCHLYPSPSGTGFYNESEVYLDLFTSDSACDTILQTTLTILEGPVVNSQIFACGEFTAPSGNQTISSSGTYYDLVPSNSGCDTLYTLDVIVHDDEGSAVCDDYKLQFAGANNGTGTITPNGVVFDHNENTISTGFYFGNADFDPSENEFILTNFGFVAGYVQKLNPTGNLVWAVAVGNQASNTEVMARDVAVDEWGNIYVTGDFVGTVDFDPGLGSYELTSTGSSRDIFVYKLDPNGQFLWAHNFGNSISSADFNGRGIEVNSNGEVLVTGWFRGTIDFDPGPNTFELTANSSTTDGYVLKLDQGGNFLWAGRLGGSGTCLPYAITTDNSGNILLTGRFNGTINFDPGPGTQNSTSASSSFDGFILKLSPMGVFSWRNSLLAFNPLINAVDIATNSDNHVFVTGSFSGNIQLGSIYTTTQGGNSIYLLRLSSAGAPIWLQGYGSNFSDGGAGVAIGPNDDIWFTGEFHDTVDFMPSSSEDILVTSNGSTDVFITRLSNSGEVLSVQSYGSSSMDSGTGIAVSESGKVAAIGRFNGNVDFLYGDQEYFVNSPGSSPGSYQIHLDICSNITFGTLEAEACNEYESPSGQFVWTSSGVYEDILSNSLGCDSVITVDLTIIDSQVFSYSASACDSYTSPSGNAEWLTSGQFTDILDNPEGCDFIHQVDLTIYNSTSTEIDFFACESFQLNDNAEIWETSGTYTDTLQTIYGCDSIIYYQLTLYKDLTEECDSRDLDWVMQSAGNLNVAVTSMATDNANNLFAVGTFEGSVTFNTGDDEINLQAQGQRDSYIIKSNASGQVEWAKQFSSQELVEAKSIAIDSQGNLIITGLYNGTTDFDPGPSVTTLPNLGTNDGFLVKLTSMGEFVWAKRMGSAEAVAGTGVAVDNSDNILAIGDFFGVINLNSPSSTYSLVSQGWRDVYVAKYSPEGNIIWGKRFGGTFDESAASVQVDQNNNVYASGSFRGTVDFNPGTEVNQFISAGAGDIFALKLTEEGDYIWAGTAGGSQHEHCSNMTIDHSGNVFVTGSFNGTANFNPTSTPLNLVSQGAQDAFVWKLNNNGSTAWAKRIGGPTNERGMGLSTTANQGVVVCGWFNNTVLVSTGPDMLQLTSAGASDAFVAEFSAQGNVVTAYSFGGTGSDAGLSVLATANHEIYTCGDFTGTANFNLSAVNTEITSFGAKDGYIQKILKCEYGPKSFLEIESCDPVTSPSGDQLWYTSGTYTDYLPGDSSCDTVLTAIVSILGFADTTTVEACTPYFWDAANVEYDQSGVFAANFINQFGCDSTLYLNLTYNEINLSLSDSGITLIANEPEATYQWLDCNNDFEPIPGATEQSYTPVQNGSYAVEIAKYNCTEVSDCYTVIGVFVENMPVPGDLTVFPNPTRGSVRVQFDHVISDCHLKLHDSSGRIVQEKMIMGESEFQFEVTGVSGTYYLELLTNDSSRYIVKIVKL